MALKPNTNLIRILHKQAVEATDTWEKFLTETMTHIVKLSATPDMHLPTRGGSFQSEIETVGNPNVKVTFFDNYDEYDACWFYPVEWLSMQDEEWLPLFKQQVADIRAKEAAEKLEQEAKKQIEHEKFQRAQYELLKKRYG